MSTAFTKRPEENQIKQQMLDSWGRTNNRKLPDRKCDCCGKIFRPKQATTKACSRPCSYKIRNWTPHNKGKSNGWVNAKGYRELKINGKSIKEHRHIVEKMLGRTLLPNEHVHHIDGDKQNNKPENLQILSDSEHSKLHNSERTYKKGYKVNITPEERLRRSEWMRMLHKQRRLKALDKASGKKEEGEMKGLIINSQTHRKCLTVLAMIDAAEERLFRAKKMLMQFDNARWDNPMILFNKRGEIVEIIENNKRLLNRLVQYYTNTAAKLKPLESQLLEALTCPQPQIPR